MIKENPGSCRKHNIRIGTFNQNEHIYICQLLCFVYVLQFASNPPIGGFITAVSGSSGAKLADGKHVMLCDLNP